MAKAYGGLSQNQYDKLLQMKKIKEMQNTQLSALVANGGIPTGKPPIARNASNMSKVNLLPGQKISTRLGSIVNENDNESDFGGGSVLGQKFRQPSNVKRVGGGFAPPRN